MQTATLDNVSNTIPQVKPLLPEIGEFGNGRYSPLAGECYKDIKSVFGLDDKPADKLARMIASDFGSAVSQGKVTMKSAKVGKISDDGKVTLTEAANKVKNITMTDALYCLKALKYAKEAGDNGFVWGKTKWQVNDHIAKFLGQLN